MKKSFRDNLIASILIVSISITPSLFILTETSRAEAAPDSTSAGTTANSYQQSSSYQQNSSYQQPINSYGFNMSSVMTGGLLGAVIGCTGVTNKLTKFLNNIFSPSGTSDTGLFSDNEIEQMNKNLVNYDSNGNAVSTKDYTTAASAAKSAQIATIDKARTECFNGIAVYLARKQLADMTQMTVNWINTGFNGNPFYVRDQDSFYQSIRNQSLTELLGPFADPQYAKNYPYGREFARGLIMSTANGVQSGLVNTMRVPPQTFSNSFSSGGWSEWLNMTQNMGNNPLGFSLGASNYIEGTIDQRIANQTQELTQNNGFLSQKRCVQYKEVQDLGTGVNGPSANKTCVKWETVTPGSIIASQLQTSLSSPVRQLELANDINSSMNQVFSALINQLVNMGLSGLDNLYNKNNVTYDTSGSYEQNRVLDVNGNDITGQYYDQTGKIISMKGTTGWHDANGKEFDITTDLGDSCTGGTTQKGIISIQKDYLTAIKGDPKAGIVGSQDKLYKIMPALGKLDAAIPGPNPLWENSTQMGVNASIAYTNDMSVDDIGNVVYPDESNYDNMTYDSSHPWRSLNVINTPAITSGTGANATHISQYTNLIGTIGLALLLIPGVGWVVGAAAEGVMLVGQAVDWITGGSKKKREQAKIDAEWNAKRNFENWKTDTIKQLRATFEQYKAIVDAVYGPDSPMLKQDYYGYDDNGNMKPNTAYLPSAVAGLELTKNISIYAINVNDTGNDYDTTAKQITANIHELQTIKAKVDAIMRKARARQMQNVHIDPRCLNINSCGANIAVVNSTTASASVDMTNASAGVGGGVSAAPCQIDSFKLTDSRDSRGGTVTNSGTSTKNVTLSWGTTSCTDVSISRLGVQSLSGSATFVPASVAKAGEKIINFILTASQTSGFVTGVPVTKTLTVSVQ